MPKPNFKSITVSSKIYDRLQLSSEKVNFLLKQKLIEKENLQKFASKIKKYPETVSVYTNPWMTEKERGE